MDVAADAIASIAWDIAGGEARIQEVHKLVFSSGCFLDTHVGSLIVVPMIHLEDRPDVLQARIIYVQGTGYRPPTVWVSADLGPHQDCYGEDSLLVLDVLEQPALRVVLCCGERRFSGVVTQPLILRPKANLAKGETEWIADDVFPDVRKGVLAVLAAYGEENAV